MRVRSESVNCLQESVDPKERKSRQVSQLQTAAQNLKGESLVISSGRITIGESA